MSPKILLIVARHRDHWRTFPFGATTIFGILKENNYKVDYVDCDFEHKNIEDMISISELSGYNIIAISGIISCYKHVKYDLIPIIKKHAPKSLIIIGGYLATSIPELLLKNNLCDIAFIGEGNESILEFLKVYDQPNQWGNIKGIAFKETNGYIANTGMRVSREFWGNIVPYYKYIDINYYNSFTPQADKFYPVLAEIGCPYRCEFCFNSSGVFGHKIRSPKSVVEEIIEAKKRYDFKYVNIMGENLLSKPTWINEFCELLDENKLTIQWGASGHANTINKGILKLIKSHGCSYVGIGFENYSQKILDNMNKKVKVEKYKEIIKLFRRYDFKISGTCIFGYFGEDYSTVEENIQFMKKNYSPHEFFWIQPYPLTEFWNKCKEKKIFTNDEEMIEKLGEADDFVINVTEFTDVELFGMKEKIDKAVKDLSNHRKLSNIVLYVKSNGIFNTVKKLLLFANRKVFGLLGKI